MTATVVRLAVRAVALAIGATDWQSRTAGAVAVQCWQATSDPWRAIRVGIGTARSLRGARRPSTAIELPNFTAYGERVAAMRIVGGSAESAPSPKRGAVLYPGFGQPDED